jgi:hypothetical protein
VSSAKRIGCDSAFTTSLPLGLLFGFNRLKSQKYSAHAIIILVAR